MEFKYVDIEETKKLNRKFTMEELNAWEEAFEKLENVLND